MTAILPTAITAPDAPARTRPSGYPQAFAARMAGPELSPPGDSFGLKNLGFNLARLAPGCAGFQAGTDDAHQRAYQGKGDVVVLEVGNRSAGNSTTCPDDALQAVPGDGGKWRLLGRNGTPYGS